MPSLLPSLPPSLPPYLHVLQQRLEYATRALEVACLYVIKS